MHGKHRKQTILVPVDFSLYSEIALLKACEIASCMNLPVVVLHVVNDPSQMPGYYSKMRKKKNLVRIEDIAKEMLDEFMGKMAVIHAEIKCVVEAESLLVMGLPVGRILEVAERINAVMIVMGSQGRTGLEHVLLGSKAEQVVRLSPVSVTIVKANKNRG